MHIYTCMCVCELEREREREKEMLYKITIDYYYPIPVLRRQYLLCFDSILIIEYET